MQVRGRAYKEEAAENKMRDRKGKYTGKALDTVSMYVYRGETIKKQTAKNKHSIKKYDRNTSTVLTTTMVSRSMPMNMATTYTGFRARLWLPSSTIRTGGYRRHSTFGPKL